MEEIFKIASGSTGEITTVTLILAILLAGGRGMWYYGGVYRDLVKDRDDWKTIATSATSTVKDQAGQIEKLTEIIEGLSNRLNVRRR